MLAISPLFWHTENGWLVRLFAAAKGARTAAEL